MHDYYLPNTLYREYPLTPAEQTTIDLEHDTSMIDQGWNKMQNFPGIWSKMASKCKLFTNFQKFFEEKDQNIHLKDKFPLKSCVKNVIFFYKFSAFF